MRRERRLNLDLETEPVQITKSRVSHDGQINPRKLIYNFNVR